MTRQKRVDGKCARCEHFSTSAKTDKPGDIEAAAKLAKEGVGRCTVLEVSTLWSTVCIHFDKALDAKGHRERYAAKQIQRQGEVA